jgi:hypothetical protein
MYYYGRDSTRTRSGLWSPSPRVSAGNLMSRGATAQAGRGLDSLGAPTGADGMRAFTPWVKTRRDQRGNRNGYGAVG